jgi:hypothetical protein
MPNENERPSGSAACAALERNSVAALQSRQQRTLLTPIHVSMMVEL